MRGRGVARLVDDRRVVGRAAPERLGARAAPEALAAWLGGGLVGRQRGDALLGVLRAGRSRRRAARAARGDARRPRPRRRSARRCRRWPRGLRSRRRRRSGRARRRGWSGTTRRRPCAGACGLAGRPASRSPQAPRLSSPETLALVAGHSHANLPLALARVPTDRRIATYRRPRSSTRRETSRSVGIRHGVTVVISRDAKWCAKPSRRLRPGRGSFRGEVQGRGPVCVVQNTNVIAVGIEPALLVGHEQRPADAAHRRAEGRPQRAARGAARGRDRDPARGAPGARAAAPARAAVGARRPLPDRLLSRPSCRRWPPARWCAWPPRSRRRRRPRRCWPTPCRRSSTSCSWPRCCRACCACAAPSRPSARACARCCPARASSSRPSPSRWSRRCAAPAACRRCSTTRGDEVAVVAAGRVRGVPRRRAAGRGLRRRADRRGRRAARAGRALARDPGDRGGRLSDRRRPPWRAASSASRRPRARGAASRTRRCPAPSVDMTETARSTRQEIAV